MPSLAVALLLQLHHFRQHAAHPVHRSIGAVHDEGKPPTRVDDTVHHGIGGCARTAGCRACHRILFRFEETGTVTGGPGANAHDSGTTRDRVGSQHGDLSRRYVRRECRR